MSGTNTFKAAFLITGEVGASFRRAMSGTAKETNILKTELTSLQRTLSKTQSYDKSRNSLQAQLTKYNELKAEAKALGGQLAATATPSAKLQAAFDKATLATESARAALREHFVQLKKNDSELKKAGVDTKNLTSEQVRLEQQLAKTNERLRRVDEMKSAVGRLGGAFRNLKDDIFKATVAVAGFTAAAYGIYRFTESAAEFSSSSSEIGKSLGMTATELQQVRYAALQSGIAIEDSDAAIGKMIKTTRMARDQYSAVGKAFLRLGLDARALSFASPKMQLELLSGAFAKLKNERERAELGQEIFGVKDGPRFAALLSQGADKWTAAQRRALEVGYALSKEENERAEATKKNMAEFQARMTGIKNKLGSELMPAINDALTSVSNFLTENRGQIMEFGRMLGVSIRQGLPVILDFAKAGLRVASVIGQLIGIMPSWLKHLALAGTLMAAGTALAIKFAVDLAMVAWAFKSLGMVSLKPLIIEFGMLALEAAAFTAAIVGTSYALYKLASIMLEIKRINAIGKESGKAADDDEHRLALLRRQRGIKPVTEREKRMDRELDQPSSRTGWAPRGRRALTGSSAPSGSAASPPSGSVTHHNEIHVHPPAGTSSQEIANQLLALISRKQRDAERLGPSGFAYAQ